MQGIGHLGLGVCQIGIHFPRVCQCAAAQHPLYIVARLFIRCIIQSGECICCILLPKVSTLNPGILNRLIVQLFLLNTCVAKSNRQGMGHGISGSACGTAVESVILIARVVIKDDQQAAVSGMERFAVITGVVRVPAVSLPFYHDLGDASAVECLAADGPHRFWDNDLHIHSGGKGIFESLLSDGFQAVRQFKDRTLLAVRRADKLQP